jgi:phage recombination protein Bet
MATQTQDRPKQQADNRQQEQGRELAPLDRLTPSRLPITHAMMEKLKVTPESWHMYTDQIYSEARTVEGIRLAIEYCRARNLDIIKKPVHVVAVYSAAQKKMVERVWEGIASIRTTAHRTNDFAGNDDVEHGPEIEQEFELVIKDDRDPRNDRTEKFTVKYPEWSRMNVYRFVHGQRCLFAGPKVFWLETYATVSRWSNVPNEMWRKRPRGQNEKCAEAAALRRAFPEELGNTYSADEMEGKVIDAAGNPDPDYRPGRSMRTVNPDVAAEREATAVSNSDLLRNKAREMADKMPDDKIVDVDVEDQVDVAGEDSEPFDFDEFAARLADAPDEATVQEVWKAWNIDERFADSAADMTIALKAKMLRLRQIKAAAQA